jgi:thiamine biosynthesis protein ThiS
VRIQLNGQDSEVAAETSVQELITKLELTPQRVAVELNHQVIRRQEWDSTKLQEDDQVEIVHFVGGGSKRLISAF